MHPILILLLASAPEAADDPNDEYLTVVSAPRQVAVEETIGKPLLEALQDAAKINSVEKLVFESAAGTLTIAK